MSRIWEQRPDESSKAYAAFCGYRNLGPERTVVKAYEIYTGLEVGSKQAENPAYGTPSFFNQWSARYEWVKRAREFDAHIEQLRTEAIETQAVQEAKKWASRFEQLREQEFEVGQSMIERAQEMMEFPLVRTETKTDGQVVIVMPAEWKPADVVAYMNAASKLARLAIGTHTDLSATREVEQQEMRIGDRVVRF